MNKPRPADAVLYQTAAEIEDARARHLERATALRLRLANVTKVIGGALLLALTLRSLVFEPFTITSASMQPGLLVGDYLFVAKWPYGYSRYSLPLALPLWDGRWPADRMAARGDVVVFKATADNRTDFIKRVIGLPGDRVAVSHGQLVINGVAVPRVATATSHQYRETLAGRSYIVAHRAGETPLDDFAPVVVPPEHYFLLGDNRDNSADSRLALIDGGVGMVPAGNLVGRADRVFFSVDAAQLRRSPLHWPTAIRSDRIGAQF